MGSSEAIYTCLDSLHLDILILENISLPNESALTWNKDVLQSWSIIHGSITLFILFSDKHEYKEIIYIMNTKFHDIKNPLIQLFAL